jgi:thymidylate synthase ThyX
VTGGCEEGADGYGSALMDRTTAIAQIREACKNIALQMMKIQPVIPKLEDAATQADCIKAAYELTIQLEIIKKKIGRLEKQDDSTLL